MDSQRAYAFMPSPDGEYIPVKFKSPKDLKETEVIIFLDEEDRQIFIWTGSKSNVRKRFISSQIARQMRLEKGLTHRISTEDQGNETSKFLEFINIVSEKGLLSANTLLEVTPTSSFDVIDEKDMKSKKTIPESIIPKLAPETPQMSTTKIPFDTINKSKTIEAEKESISLEREEIEEFEDVQYFSSDNVEEVLDSKAKLLSPPSEKDLIFTNLILSSASLGGKLSFYCAPKDSKILDCKSQAPILAIYIQKNSSTIELDDLFIPIPKGNSIYFSSPASTFIGINLTS
ncbi:hypothetical protein [Candidatus Hodarchaeum mangrovi]